LREGYIIVIRGGEELDFDFSIGKVLEVGEDYIGVDCQFTEGGEISTHEYGELYPENYDLIVGWYCDKGIWHRDAS